MERQNTNDATSSSSNLQSRGSAVFPGLQNYDTFFSYTGPMNLSKSAANQPIDLSPSNSPAWNWTGHASNTNSNGQPSVQKTPALSKLTLPGQPIRPKGKSKNSEAKQAAKSNVATVSPMINRAHSKHNMPASPSVNDGAAGGNHIDPQSASQKMIFLMQSSQQAASPSHNSMNIKTVLPLNVSSTVVQQLGRSNVKVKAAISSPAIHAALNQPIKPKPPTPSTKTINVDKPSAVQHAPTMMQILNMPPLQIGQPGQNKQIKKHLEKDTTSTLRAIKPAPADPLVGVSSVSINKKHLIADGYGGSNLPATFSQSFPLPINNMDKFQPVKSPFTGAAHNPSSKVGSNADTDAYSQVILTPTVVNDDTDFNPIDLRTAEDHKLVFEEPAAPPSPRSILESRLYKKKKKFLDKQRQDRPTSVSLPVSSSSVSSSSTSVKNLNSEADFDWTAYLISDNCKAAPHSAFKHVEASLQNGFVVGMKLETPLRDTDTDKYWLATIISVYGSILKLRFDGFGDDDSNDFLLQCNSEQIHPIGWCSKHSKSLLPPAAIRHTQRQWKNFLLSALQGAKTVPPYLLNSRSGPLSYNRIKPGMRLEVQHSNLPTAVWVVKVICNVGGRLKLRYEGSIDDTTDFWMFYRELRIHACNWALTNGCIYRPPNEIKDTHEYDVWSKILYNVSKDVNIEKMPSELLAGRDFVIPHHLHVNTAVEVVHPSGLYIFPAKVFHVINEKYFMVEMISLTENQQKFSMCCHGGSASVLPVGWCYNHSVKLQTSEDEITNPKQFWEHYLAELKLKPLIDTKTNEVHHNFKTGQRLEAVNPSKPEQICVAHIKKIIGRLMWLKVYLTDEQTTTIIYDVSSTLIFPAGWCSSNGYPVIAPKLDVLATCDFSHTTSDNICPRIYFNNKCFSGPYLSKGRLLKLPSHIGPGPMAAVLKKVLHSIVHVGYKAVRTSRLLQLQGAPNPSMTTVSISVKKSNKHLRNIEKSNEAIIEICTKRCEVADYCKLICTKLECCPNLLSTVQVKDRCSQGCHLQTKTQYLYVERRPGRPPGSGRSTSKKKKRKKKKHLLGTETNLYVPKAPSESENGSASSNAEENSSPLEKYAPLTPLEKYTPLTPLERYAPLTPLEKYAPLTLTPKDSTKTEALPDGVAVDVVSESPLYQLQLTSVQKGEGEAEGEAEEVPQYQIVKRKRGRPPKQQTPETAKNGVAISPRTHLTVPPLKIRRLETSPPSSSSSETMTNGVGLSHNSSLMSTNSNTTITSAITLVTTSSSATTTTTTPLPNGVNQQTAIVAPKSLGGLLKAAVPHVMNKSALTFTRTRIHIEDRDKVQLTDNPLYWDVNKLVTFIKQTDCAYLSDLLIEHAIDGQAFMMLILPTVQEELDLKLGPALKLCHHVQRLKLAFYETFHPDNES